MTIWDGGGIDTYDFSNYGTDEDCIIDIDLSPGGWTTVSSCQLADLDGDGDGDAAGNIANSLAVDAAGKPVGPNGTPVNLIENVIGSPYDDHIIGNSADNNICGGMGNDVIDGGAGNDTFVFSAGFGDDQITRFDADPTGGQDLLDVSALGIIASGFTDVAITHAGADTLVTIGEDSILLIGVKYHDVTQSDFLDGSIALLTQFMAAGSEGGFDNGSGGYTASPTPETIFGEAPLLTKPTI